MKKAKKVMALLLATISAGTVFTACTPKEDYGDRTVLRVGMYNGGWGTEWLDKVVAKFEAEYPQYKILVDGDKTKYNTNSLLGVIDTGRQDLFIAPMFLYDFVSQDKLMDITDIMTTPLNELVSASTDTATIKSKMWAELDEFYSGFSEEEKYYSIPFGGGIYSLNYDRDLFNEKSLFIQDDTSADNGNIVWVNESGNLSAGQDGQKGTYDDGLPVSDKDFKALLKEMKRQNVTPFIWSKQNGYMKNFLYSLMASYEGKDNFNLLTKMDGEYTFAGDSVATKITPETAYKLQGMTGKKVALDFAYDIVKDSANYHEDSGRETCDFLDAQNKYLMSVDMAKTGDSNRVAFLIDGAHWYNEAKGTIDQMAEESDDYKNRRFGIMPFPKFEGGKATKATYYASSFNIQVCIRKRAEQPELAKLFLAYLHTEESLRACTEYSGMVRPLAYTMPTETLEKMPYYYQSLWYTFSNADIVHHVSKNPYIYNNSWFFEDEWLWTCHTSNGMPLSNPFLDLIDRTKDVSTQDYWDALKYTFNATYWKEKVLDKVDG